MFRRSVLRCTKWARSEIAKLQQAGARVEVRAVDVSDRAQVAALLKEIGATMPPLGGVAHLAAVLDDGVLLEQSPARLERALAAKAWGAWHLHELTRRQDLDFFVLYSSVASVFGSAGQANYAAANAFLDALAVHRRAQGLTGLSVNWGPVAEVGMAARAGARSVEDRLQRMGIEALSPAQTTMALEALLSADAVSAVVARLNVPRLAAALERTGPVPLLAGLAAAAAGMWIRANDAWFW